MRNTRELTGARGCALAVVSAAFLAWAGFLSLHAALTGGWRADFDALSYVILLLLLGGAVAIWRGR
jgi:hypothetical protein